MGLFREEDGQVLVLAVLCMAVLMGFMALAIDVGGILFTRRQLQTAADSAALAAALEMQQCNGTADCATMQTAATSAMTENGYASAAVLTQCAANPNTGLTLTLNNGPCALGSRDPNNGNASFVEAVVSKQEPVIFGALLGVHPITVSARSEAGPASSSNCVFVSADNWTTSAGTAMTMNSGSHLTASCGVIDDSGANSALWLDNGSHTSATSINVHGTYSTNNGAQYSPTPNNNALAVADPLSWVPQPSVGACTPLNAISGKNNTLNQGTYCGLNVNSGGSLTLNPGTYVFEGNVTVDSGATMAGSGVTLYFSSGTMLANSGSTMNLIAPTSGTYAGILLFQSPSDGAGMVMDSGSKSVWQGAVYLPGANLTVNSGGNAAAYTIIDVQSLTIDSGGKLVVGDDYSSLPGGSPARVTKLME